MTASDRPTTTEDQLQEANAFLDGDVRWLKVNGLGTTNKIYRGTLKGKLFVLRLNQKSHTLIGVCRQREDIILKLIQKFPWAANVIHNNWQRGWCLMQDHGETLEPDNACTHTRQQIYSLIAQCQSLSIQLNSMPHAQSIAIAAADLAINYAMLLKNYHRLFDQQRTIISPMQAVGESIHNCEINAKFLQELTRHTQDLLKKLPKLPPCLVHHDLHPGNICSDNQQIKVIDWEYAGLSNPLIDAVALRNHWDFSIQELAALPIFSQLKRQDLIKGLDISERVVSSLDTLWNQAQKISKGRLHQRIV